MKVVFLCGCLLLVKSIVGNDCPPLTKEVCGSDGITYKNIDEIREKIVQGIVPGLKIVYHGPCGHPITEQGCTCTGEHGPVCGNDNRTYGNRCIFNCSQLQYPNLQIVHDKDCEEKLKK